MSRIMWYDYKGVLKVNSGNLDLIRDFFYIYSVFFIPVIFYWIINFFKLKIETVSFYTLLLAIYGIILAIINGNDLNYIIGDTFKFLILISSIYIGMNFSGKNDNILRYIVYIGVTFAFFRFYLFYNGFVTSFGFAYGVTQDIFLFFAAFILLIQKPTLLKLILFIATLILIMLGQKRSLFIIIILLLPFCLFWVDNRQKKTSITLFIIISILIAILISIIAPSNINFHNNLGRITHTNWSEKLKFQDGRNDEATLVIEEINKNQFAFLGSGSGAKFNNGDKITHSIHITPLALFFRYGILGILFYLYLFFKITYMFYKNFFYKRHKKNDSLYILSNLYVLGSIIMSLAIFGFIDDPLTGFCLGYILSKNRNQPT